MDVKKSGLFALVLLAGAAVGAITNGLLNLGDEVTGSIDDYGQEDTYLFSAVKDTKVTIMARAYGYPKSLKPRVRVTDLTTNSVLVDASTNQLVYIKKLPLPSTGEYMITISGAQDTLGGYKLKTAEKLSWLGINQKDFVVVPGDGGVLEVGFDAAAGWAMDARFEVKSANPIMTSPTLTSPSGIDLDLGQFLQVIGPNLKILDVPLPELGTYQLTATNVGLTGLVKWRVKLDPKGPDDND